MTALYIFISTVCFPIFIDTPSVTRWDKHCIQSARISSSPVAREGETIYWALDGKIKLEGPVAESAKRTDEKLKLIEKNVAENTIRYRGGSEDDVRDFKIKRLEERIQKLEEYINDAENRRKQSERYKP